MDLLIIDQSVSWLVYVESVHEGPVHTFIYSTYLYDEMRNNGDYSSSGNSSDSSSEGKVR
jgi:hypothetical protein